MAPSSCPADLSIATCSRDGTARLWSVPAISTTPAGQLGLEATVITGMELRDDDLPRLLDVSTWRSRRKELEELRASEGR